MSEPALLADHIDEQTDAIIALWRTTVERVGDVPDAERLSYQEFVDHIPDLLDRIADRLRGRAGDATSEGKKHGEVRWRQGYDIGAIITEFAHLRTALGRATTDYARERGWDVVRLSMTYNAIDAVLAEATAESIRQFQEDSQATTRAALAEIKSRQRDASAAEARARAEQAKLQTILDSLPAAVWVTDAAGTIESANDVARRMHVPLDPQDLGRTSALELGSALRLFRPDGSPFPPSELPTRRALRGETVIQEEILWELPEGTRVLSINAAPLLGPEGKLSGSVGIAQDVTERKRDTEELRRQRDLFRTITEAQGEGLCTLDMEARVTFLNPAAERLFGWSRDELIGSELHEKVHYRRPDGSPYPYEECPLCPALPGGLTVQGDEVFLRKDGRWITLSFIATPIITDGQHVGHIVVLRDISERIANEAALREQRERAEEASRHKTRLVAALSHDVRTPLNAVVLAAQLLEIHYDREPDAEVQESLRTIRHSVRNVLDLLGDLLNLSKLDAGAVPPEVSYFALDDVLAECLASVETQARLKGLEVRLEHDGIAGKNLQTDRSKLKQIIANFLSNAVRYTDRGEVRLSAEHRAGQVRIAVADTGVGIEPKDQERIFDEFAILENPRRSTGEGTGLGLAICRRLAGLLGGEILLQSTPAGGSTFTLVLPDTLLTHAPSGPAPDVPAARARAEAGSIVVAEDHPDSRQTLAKVLRRMGYRVLEASNGRDALQLIETERPLAVLMDVNMPIMNGVDATLALRADPRFRDLPIFALTGDVTPDNQQRIGEAGVNGYLEKPVTWELLRQALASIGESVSH